MVKHPSGYFGHQRFLIQQKLYRAKQKESSVGNISPVLIRGQILQRNAAYDSGFFVVKSKHNRPINTFY
jgi:hypothetical protein